MTSTTAAPTPPDRPSTPDRPVVLITGASRRIGIGAAIARRLATSGWNVAFTYWRPYDEGMPWGSAHDDVAHLGTELRELGAQVVSIEADLAQPLAASQVVIQVVETLGTPRALVLSHCDGSEAGILDTTIDDFDRVFAVNARATWLLIRAFAEQFTGPHGTGRIVSLTSDHTAGNLAYGASKGAMDRIVAAAAVELAHLGITANVVNPGPTDTGWMNDSRREAVIADTLAGRLGAPEDAAALVGFLCSPDGGWVNGQLLHSDGGFRLA